MIEWLSYNPYKSVVSAIAPVNEPNGVYYAEQGNHMQVTKDFYTRSYATLQKAGYSMFFHHGFVNNPADYWRSWAEGKNTSMLVINDNPYPGWFPAVNDTGKIGNLVCQQVTSYDNFPVPMVKSEFSLVSGPTDQSWNEQYYSDQVSAYAAGAGSFFWTFKMMNSSNPVKAETPDHQMQYSFLHQVAMGAVPKMGSNRSSTDYIQGLPNHSCDNLQQTFSSS